MKNRFKCRSLYCLFTLPKRNDLITEQTRFSTEKTFRWIPKPLAYKMKVLTSAQKKVFFKILEATILSVARAGIEPATSGLWILRSNHLSYLAIQFYILLAEFWLTDECGHFLGGQTYMIFSKYTCLSWKKACLPFFDIIQAIKLKIKVLI